MSTPNYIIDKRPGQTNIMTHAGMISVVVFAHAKDRDRIAQMVADELNGVKPATIAPAEAKGDALLAAIAASAASAGDYQPHDQVVSMFAVESAIRGAELDTPQPAGGEAVAIYQLVSEDVPREWQDIDKATFDFWQGRDRRTRIVYATPPAAQVRHKFWGAGEADCPREIKAGNGELHTLRCKVCGLDNPDGPCTAAQVQQEATLPVVIFGETYDVPIRVQLHIEHLRMKLEAIGQAAQHHPITDLLDATEHCLSAADEGVDYAVSRPMLDAMTTLGLMEKVRRGRWAPTDSARRFVTLARSAHPSACELGAWVPADTLKVWRTDIDYAPAQVQAGITVMLEAALQHRGDSQEVGRG